MTLSFFSMIFFYWLFLGCAIFLAGAYMSRLVVTGPAGADVCVPTGKKECIGDTASRYALYISLFAVFANAIHLVFHASVMTETGLNEISSVLWPFLTKTKYGRFTLLRSAFLFALLVTSLVAVKKEKRLVKIWGLIFSLSLLVVISMSGHQGVKGYWNIPFVLDVVHLVAVSLWIGGVFLLRLSFATILRDTGKELLELSRNMIKKFSDLATYCVAGASLAGILLAFHNIKDVTILTERPYGIVLLIKIFLVCVILILGGGNKFFIIPSLYDADERKWLHMARARHMLYRFVTVEAYLGFAVLLATSLLTHLSPEG